MADKDLEFPRLMYRGAPDTLGQGTHPHPTTGALIGETKTVASQDECDEAKKDGWRLTRDEPHAAHADHKADAVDAKTPAPKK